MTIQGSQYDKEDPQFAYFMSNQGADQVMQPAEQQTKKAYEMICAL